MKKVAIIAHGLGNGGAEHVAMNLANYFVQTYEVLFIAAFSGKQDYALDPRVRVKVISNPYKNKIARLIGRNIEICSEISKFAPNRVISFLTNEALFTHFRGYSMIYSLRNDPVEEDKRFLDRAIRKFAYRTCYRVVFQTRGAMSYFPERIRKKGVIIANPVHCDALPVWDKQNHNNTFITFGRLTPQKNLPMLIKAFAQFHENYPQCSLDIYGRGELEETLRELIARLRGEEYIHLRGFSSDIHNILSQSYAYVLSSDYEGLSNAMLEALAIGIPSICTDCPPGGAREYIKDGVSGLLTKVGDVDSMVSVLEKLASGELDTVAMSEEAIKVRERIDYDKVCEMWESAVEMDP